MVKNSNAYPLSVPPRTETSRGAAVGFPGIRGETKLFLIRHRSGNLSTLFPCFFGVASKSLWSKREAGPITDTLAQNMSVGDMPPFQRQDRASLAVVAGK